MDGDSPLPDPEPDDGELLRRYAAARSEEAFAALVRRHLGLVYNVALRRVGGDPQLAEDVAQRVFADLAAKAASLQRHPAVTGWLFTGTHYAASQLVRTERRRKDREQQTHAMNELLREAGPAVEWERLRPLLDDLLLELPARDREAVLLRFFEGRPFAEVGVRLRLTDHGARARVERAVEKLRGKLARRGVTSTSAALGLALAHQAAAAPPAGLAASVTVAALAAPAATGGAVAAGLIGFMSTAKITTGIAAVAAIAGIGFGVAERSRAQAAAEETAALRQQLAALAQRVTAAEQRAARPEAAPTSAEALAARATRAATALSEPALTVTPSAAPRASAPGAAAPATDTPTPTLEATKQMLAVVYSDTGRVSMDAGHVTNIHAWAERDPTGLIAWIGTLPLKQQEHTIEAVIAVETEPNPEFAFLIAGGIERELPRGNRRSTILKSWAPRDPAAAARAVAEVPEAERERLTMMLRAYSRPRPPAAPR